MQETDKQRVMNPQASAKLLQQLRVAQGRLAAAKIKNVQVTANSTLRASDANREGFADGVVVSMFLGALGVLGKYMYDLE